jgi:hypothetical protein
VLFKLNGRLNTTHTWKSAPGMETASLSDVPGTAWSASAIAAKANALAKTDKTYRGCIGLTVGNEKPRDYGTLVPQVPLAFLSPSQKTNRSRLALA